MKKVFVLVGLIILPISIHAQEKYFHDLKGFENSNGDTELLYRLYAPASTLCTDFDGNTYPSNTTQNHIYYFDATQNNDEVFLQDYFSITPGCDYVAFRVGNYIFPTNHIDSVLAFSGEFGGLFGGWGVNLNSEFRAYLGYINPMGLFHDPITKNIIVTTPIYDLVVKARSKTNTFQQSFIYNSQDTIWHEITTLDEIPDSLFLDFTITGIDTSEAGTYVGLRDSFFVMSNDFGKTISDSVNIHIKEWEIGESTIIDDTYFASDSISYLVFKKIDSHLYGAPKLVYQIQIVNDTVSYKDLGDVYHPTEFYPDLDCGSCFYFSKQDSLYQSKDLGESVSLIQSFEYEITGLYKKPSTDILYVLTKEELFRLNLETGTSTPLRSIPVNNELVLDLPTQLILHQNYPNPFNPSTAISYELSANSHVRLKVYDLLGREVAELVNTQQSAGMHEVTFNASALSSGMYLYRIEANGAFQTKRFTLIK